MRNAESLLDYDTEGFKLYGQHLAKLSIMIDISEDSPDGENSVKIWLCDDHGIGESCQDSILPMLQKYYYLKDVARRLGGDPIPTDPLWGEPWIDRCYSKLTIEQIVGFLEDKLQCKLVPRKS